MGWNFSVMVVLDSILPHLMVLRESGVSGVKQIPILVASVPSIVLDVAVNTHWKIAVLLIMTPDATYVIVQAISLSHVYGPL